MAYLVVVLALLLGALLFLQVLLVPIIAARKGREAGLWFLVTVLWLLVVGSSASVLISAGMIAFAERIFALALAAGALVGLLPLWTIVAMSSRKGSDHRRRDRHVGPPPAGFQCRSGTPPKLVRRRRRPIGR